MKKIFIFVMLFIASAQSHSAPKTVQIIEQTQQSIYRDSSEYHRMNKRFSLGWEMLGAGPVNANDVGLSASYFLDRNTILSLELLTGTNKGQYLFSFSNSNFEYKGKSAAIYLKKFMGNSFYIKTGMEYRDVSYAYINDSFDYSYSFSGTSLGAAILIGNQWQWENFTLGCDWVGIGVPVTSQVTSEKVSALAYLEDAQRDQKRYVTGSYMQLMRFYIGYSF